MTREQELAEFLTKCSYEYYETGEVIVDDETFNAAEDELRLLNPNHPILTTVGYGYDFNGIDEKEKFEHPISVGSIIKEKTLSGLIEWIGSSATTLSTKIDGNSVVLYYKNRKLWKAVTRGRFNIGIDRTAKFIGVVPNEIPFDGYIAVRGEAAIKKVDYTVENGFDIEKSSRNAVAGAISRKDEWEHVMKFVDFIAYTYINIENMKDLCNEIDWSQYFITENQKNFTLEYISDIPTFKKEVKDDYPYEADGAVFKKTNGSLLAFKFEDEKGFTREKEIEITIGVDQRLTPVAILDPIKLNGALIKRASLGSFGIAIRSGFWPIYEDHIVEIIRSNEVIPHANRVVSKGERLLDDTKLVPTCPVCGSVGEADGEHYFCVNPECPNIESSKLYKFAKFFYPEGLGNAVMGKVFRHFNVSDVFDLFTVDLEALEYVSIPGIGDSNKDKILQFFTKINGNIDPKIIYQVFIQACGKTFARVIAEHGVVFADCVNSTEKLNELYTIKSFRKEIVEQLKRNASIFEKVNSVMKIVDEKIVETVGSFCITGTRFSSAQVKRLEAKGWKEDSSVKKTTTVLVVADLDQVSGKTKKADSYGIPVMTIEDFMDTYMS